MKYRKDKPEQPAASTCNNCPLAEMLESIIKLNKKMLSDRFLDFKPVKDFKTLSITKIQLN